MRVPEPAIGVHCRALFWRGECGRCASASRRLVLHPRSRVADRVIRVGQPPAVAAAPAAERRGEACCQLAALGGRELGIRVQAKPGVVVAAAWFPLRTSGILSFSPRPRRQSERLKAWRPSLTWFVIHHDKRRDSSHTLGGSLRCCGSGCRTRQQQVGQFEGCSRWVRSGSRGCRHDMARVESDRTARPRR